MKRVILAFLIAPMPAASIQSVMVAVWPKEGKGVFEHPLSMFVAICLLFYLIELVLALPLYLATRKRGPRKMVAYAVAGTLLVLLAVMPFLGLSVTRGELSAYAIAYNLAFFALGGFFAGVVFWRVTTPRIDLSAEFGETFS
jgi:hypothetical protein